VLSSSQPLTGLTAPLASCPGNTEGKR